MLKKFKPGSYVMLKPYGIPMIVTMYVDKHLDQAALAGGEALVCVTWETLDGKIRTARFKEKTLQACPLKEWNGRSLEKK